MRHVNIKLRTIKPLKDNIGGNLSHPELGRVFLDMTPKIWSIKAVKWKVGLHHNSGLLLWKKKKTSRGRKDKLQDERNIFANTYLTKYYQPEYIRNFKNSIIK